MQNKGVILSIICSIMMHLIIIFLILHKPMQSNVFSGALGEFAEFESVIVVSELPVDFFKNTNIDSVKAENSLNEVEVEKEISEAIEPKTEVDGAQDIKSDIEINKKVEKKVEEKTVKKKKAKKKKQIKKISKPSSDTDSVQNYESASAPVQSEGKKASSLEEGVSKSDISSWQGRVFSHINRYKKYPPKAILEKEEGVVYIKVKIDKNGYVISSNIKKKSKYHTLNRASVNLFIEASPLPAPPKSILKNKEYITINMPITYNIKEYFKNRK